MSRTPQHNLLTIVGTKSYMIAQPALTFKLDSSLLFTLSTGPPARRQLRRFGRADRQGDGGHHGAQCLRGHTRIGQRRFLHLQERAVHVREVRRRVCRRAEVVQRLRLGPGRRATAARGVRLERHDVSWSPTAPRRATRRRTASIRARCGSATSTQHGRDASSVWSTALRPATDQRDRASATALFQFAATDSAWNHDAVRHHLHRREQRQPVVRPTCRSCCRVSRSRPASRSCPRTPADLRDRRLQRVHHVRRRNRQPSRELRGRVEHAGHVGRPLDRQPDHGAGRLQCGVLAFNSVVTPLADHPFTYARASESADLLRRHQLRRRRRSTVQVNDTVMQATSTPPVFTSRMAPRRVSPTRSPT